MCTVHMPATAGSTVYFAESLDKVPENLKEARPTAFFGVTRIWEKFHAGLSGRLAQATGVKKHLAGWARGVCSKVNAHRNRGEAIPAGLQVKIAEDGEILIRGPNVFLGYLKEPEATAEALVDGWLCSGDLGAFDKAGFLSITGRKKEIIITAGGKNIAP